MLSRGKVSPGEWSLHPQMVQLIWSIFSEAEVDLFASEDNAHCRLFFSRNTDTLAHEWPNRPLYAYQTDQGKQMCSASYSPSLEEPALVLRVDTTAEISPVADSAEERSPHAGERKNLASLSRLMCPSRMAPQQDVRTRWNSTQYMIESLIVQKRTLSAYTAESDLPATLTANQWGLLEKVSTVLAPFGEMTREVSASSASVADVIPIVCVLKRVLSRENEADQGIKTMKSTLLDAVNRRFNDVESEPLYSVATLLDPRYKDSCGFICVFAVLINKVSLQETVEAVIGGSVLLPCSSTEHDLELEDVFWRHNGSKIVCDIIVNDSSLKQDPEYKNRTETFPEEYERGNFSIKLHNLISADAGEYTCYITHSSEHPTVKLIIIESTAEKVTISTEQENQGETEPDSVSSPSLWVGIATVIIVTVIVIVIVYLRKKSSSSRRADRHDMGTDAHEVEHMNQ
ncbi:unnamed protein product [Leuciscus chuanchicus]